MEIVLEWEEIEQMLRDGLLRRGIEVPADTRMIRRTDNKKGTIKLVFKTQKRGRGEG